MIESKVGVLKELMTDSHAFLINSGLSTMLREENLDHLSEVTATTKLKHTALLDEVYVVTEVDNRVINRVILLLLRFQPTRFH